MSTFNINGAYNQGSKALKECVDDFCNTQASTVGEIEFRVIATHTVSIDIAKERKRIDDIFVGEKTNIKKLNKLLDFIAYGDISGAKRFLEQKWWYGYDKTAHCSRLEFVPLAISGLVSPVDSPKTEILPWKIEFNKKTAKPVDNGGKSGKVKERETL